MGKILLSFLALISLVSGVQAQSILDENSDQIAVISPELVKNFTISAFIYGEWMEIAQVKDNIKRYVPVSFKSIDTKELV